MNNNICILWGHLSSSLNSMLPTCDLNKLLFLLPKRLSIFLIFLRKESNMYNTQNNLYEIRNMTNIYCNDPLIKPNKYSLRIFDIYNCLLDVRRTLIIGTKYSLISTGTFLNSSTNNSQGTTTIEVSQVILWKSRR